MPEIYDMKTSELARAMDLCCVLNLKTFFSNYTFYIISLFFLIRRV